MSLSRRTPLQRGGRPKSKPRTTAEKARIYGSAERIAWMKRQPCLIEQHDTHPLHGCMGSIECAHVENGGMGRKADFTTIVPLCTAAHHYLHSVGQRSFERYYKLDLKAEASAVEARWVAYTEGGQ